VPGQTQAINPLVRVNEDRSQLLKVKHALFKFLEPGSNDANWLAVVYRFSRADSYNVIREVVVPTTSLKHVVEAQ
jgi:hypothetical protein